MRNFLVRRFRRVVPTYWAALALSATLGATLLSHPAGTLWDGAIPVRITGVLSHFLLLQDFWWSGPAGSTAFWSLAVEWHIYLLLFPLAVLALRSRHGRRSLVALLLGLALLAPASTWLSRLHPSFYLLFLLGLISARAAGGQESPVQRRGRELGLAFVTLVGAAAATVGSVVGQFNPLSPTHGLWFGPPVAALLARMSQGSFRRLRQGLETPVLLYLGLISYSLYLTHAFVIEVVWRVAVVPLRLGESGQLMLELTGGLAASVLIATLAFLSVEKRFTRMHA
jgi:peptidoglycan/LPS O-acetylase OafA/YrhL